ncbi:MAG: molybdopterin molybdotransferase MoeA [Bacteroidales bacterium]|nr:molybdopterin molybdotransferase MoeA [Bacteroidales bacterium]
MITLEEAYKIVTSDLPRTATETIDFRMTAGRILAEDICSDMDMPPFDKAAVDGYACRRADIANPMRVLEVIAAGKSPSKTIEPGTCSKIMTGAVMPEGADCVVMVEQTIEKDSMVTLTDLKTKNNFAHKSEDIKKGEIVLAKGTCIKPQHIAVLASVGAVLPVVYKKVRVCIFSTGDELVEPDSIPDISQIRNSNGSQLVSQAIRLGTEVTYGGILPDNETVTRSAISEALKNHDVLIFSGGISMGDFDYIPGILAELGISILIRSIAVQPGKPTVFGRSGDKFIFALPGNPVSSFNIFEILAKPFIYRLMGYEWNPLIIRLPLANDYVRKGTARHGFVPATIENDGSVQPLVYNGSAHINALVSANALISVPLGTASIQKGELVDVRLI